MRAYHIDRNQSLEIGKIYHLVDIQNNQLFSKSSKMLYRDGLSHHGWTYLSQKNINFLRLANDGVPYYNSLMIDYIYEYERLLHFPEKNSRFQSLFVIADVRQVSYWIQLFSESRIEGQPLPRLLEIEFEEENLQIHDEKLLRTHLDDFSLQEIQDTARSYWNGELSDQPQLEWLIKPPFKVLHEVPVDWN